MLDAKLCGNLSAVAESFESRFRPKGARGRFYGVYDMLWFVQHTLYPRFTLV